MSEYILQTVHLRIRLYQNPKLIYSYHTIGYSTGSVFDPILSALVIKDEGLGLVIPSVSNTKI